MSACAWLGVVVLDLGDPLARREFLVKRWLVVFCLFVGWDRSDLTDPWRIYDIWLFSHPRSRLSHLYPPYARWSRQVHLGLQPAGFRSG